VAAGSTHRRLLAKLAEPTPIDSVLVTRTWLGLLGPGLARGRGFVPADFDKGAPSVAIISHHVWQVHFRGRSDIVGQLIPRVEGPPITVVGVFDRRFSFPVPLNAEDARIWQPLRDDEYDGRFDGFGYLGVARLKPGVTEAAAIAEMTEVLAALKRAHPEIEPGARIDTGVVTNFDIDAEQTAVALFFSGALYLLIAGTASIAGQRFGHALGRRREQAVQLALGASRARLCGQTLLEGALLTGAGGLLALPVAAIWIAYAQAEFYNSNRLASFRSAGLDLPTLAFAATLVLLVAIFISLPAALQVGRGGIHQTLKASSRAHSGDRWAQRLRAGLLITQVGLATLLLAAATTYAVDLFRALRSKGFATDNVVLARLEFGGHPSFARGEDRRKRRALFNESLLAKLRALPGVSAVGITWPEPFSRRQDELPETIIIAGRPLPGPHAIGEVLVRFVGGDVLAVLRVPLRQGRLPAPGREVAVSQSFVNQYFPAANPLGARIHFESLDGPGYVIVGVVGDVQHRPGQPMVPTVYRPFQQNYVYGTNFLLRSEGDPAVLAAAVRRVVRAADPWVAVTAVRTYDRHVALHMLDQRHLTSITSIFGLLAALLAALGINGATLALVAARTNEIGLRLAIGLSPAGVLGLVFARGLVPLALGVALGLGAAYPLLAVGALGLFGKTPFGPGLAAAVAGLVALTASAGLFGPAWRASRLAPMSALRHE
jgi:predicted permease